MASNPQVSDGVKEVTAKLQQTKTSGAEKISSVKSMETIFDTLQCPSCKNYLQIPVIMCASGHNICGSCHLKLGNAPCPICKGAFNGQRNIAIEKIIEQLFSLCPNSAFGCQFRAPEKNMKMHFENCEKRQFLCPLGIANAQCLWSGCLNDMKTHCKKMHPKNCTIKVAAEIKFVELDVKKEDKDLQIIFYGKSVLLYHVKIDTTKGIAFWALQLIGSPKKASGWTYNFSLYCKNSTKAIKVTESIFSNETKLETMIENGHCVGIPLNILARFKHNNDITFKIDVCSN